MGSRKCEFGECHYGETWQHSGGVGVMTGLSVPGRIMPPMMRNMPKLWLEVWRSYDPGKSFFFDVYR